MSVEQVLVCSLGGTGCGLRLCLQAVLMERKGGNLRRVAGLLF